MEEFPSNSRKQKEPVKAEVEEPKKFEKVTSGEVVRRKKPLSKRFKEIFVGDDSRGVAEYVLLDVLIPAAKDMIVDAGQTALERKFYGETRSHARRSAARGTPFGHTPYNRYSSNDPFRRPASREDPRNAGMTRRGRATHNFDEILLATRVEAEEVVDRLFDAILRYDSVTVGDLYDLVGAERSYQDTKWGWTDITGATVRRTRSGYLLDLPRPEPLD